MTVLIDTGVLYADHDRDAERHETARGAPAAVYDGDFGQPYVSDYIFDEAVTLTRTRAGSVGPAQALSEKLRGVDPYPQCYEVVHIAPALFDDAIDLFETYDDQGLSFTDATTVAVCERHGIDAIMSFDDDFDGVFNRVMPTAD